MTAGPGFDRLKPRDSWAGVTDEVSVLRPDPAGKRALYSAEPAEMDVASASGPRLQVECTGCGAVSQLSPTAALPALIPSLHLPLVRRGGSSWMRCPACRQRTWVSLRIHL